MMLDLSNLNINQWNNLYLLLEVSENKEKNFEIIEKNILPTIFTIKNDNYIGIINSIWFKDKTDNSVIDLNIYYYYDKNINKFNIHISIGDKLLRKQLDTKIIFSDILLNTKSLLNKDNINNIVNEFVINMSNNIKITHGLELKNINSIDTKSLKQLLTKKYIEKFLNKGKYNNIYIKKMIEIYNNIFFVNEYSKKEFLNYIQEFNKNFYTTLSTEEKKIRSIKNKFKYDITSVIERTAFKNRQLLIYGEKGTGKTYSIRKFVDKNNYELINIAGNNSVDELYLKGHLIRDYEGNFKWKYGKLSLAFKKALTKKVIVFIDELLRIPEETFNMLITAMDPYDGYYYLDTGKPLQTSNDIIETEEIKVPISNLWFVCATNMGNNYNVEELESAFKDRFILYYLNMNIKEKLSIIEKIVSDKKFNGSIDKIKDFFVSMDKFYTTGTLPEKINIRHISDIIIMSETEEEIPYIIYDKILIWVNNDLKGQPIKEQVNNIKKIINKIWNLNL